MPGLYRRTISFPAPRAANANANAKLAAAYRLRSASLPCRFHPLVLHLDDDVAALRLILTQSPSSASTVSAAASQVVRVLTSLSDLLHHPHAQEPLRRLATSSTSPLADRLLDDFLRLADAHGSFRESLVTLAALQAETRAAVRRVGGDPARLASAARAQRRAAARDLPRLALAARAVATRPPLTLPEDDLSPETAALVAAVADSAVAVASASAAVFSGVAALSNAAAAARVDVASTPCWITVTAAGPSSSAGSHQRVWWVADLVRWMSRAKRRSAGKQGRRAIGDDDDASTSSTAQLRPVMKPEERARKAALELHDNLERCIASVDCSGEKVFRALLNTRVSLLNILSPTF